MISPFSFLSVHLFSHLTGHYRAPIMGFKDDDTDTVFQGTYGLGESN